MSILEKLGAGPETRVGTTSSSPFTGSPTFEGTPFQVEVGKQPRLGTYVFCEHSQKNLAHYGRVIEGTEENPRADPVRLQQNQAYQIGLKEPRQGGDRSPHVTRVMTIDILGQIVLNEDGTLSIQEPAVLPHTGMGVYEFPAERLAWVLGLPDDPEDGFHLGTIEAGNSSVPFILPMEAVARQTAGVGKTGVGKTYAMEVWREESVRLGIPLFSADVLGDMRNATEDLHGKNYRAGTDFKVPYSIVGLSEFLGFVSNLTKDQQEIVAIAYDIVNDEASKMLNDDGQVDIPYQRLLDEISNVAAQSNQVAVGTRARQRVQAALNRTPLLSEGTGPWLDEMRSLPAINVFVGHLGQRGRNLVVGASARVLQTLRRRDLVPPFIFILDEAHFFLPAGGETTASTGVIRELVRTARHDAIGILLLTQSPSSMDRQALLTCNTRIVFALDKDDIRVVSGTMGDLPDAMVARIPKMPKGTAIISSSMDIIRHPVYVRIRKRVTREGAPTPNLAKEVSQWRQRKKV
jgi:hypothetical protein